MHLAGSPDIPGAGYALRRVVVATDLAALRRPLNGRWQLPLHLDASARAVDDFADPDERTEAHQLVLLERPAPPTWSSGSTAPSSRGCGRTCICRGSCGPPGRPSSPRWPWPAQVLESPGCRTGGDDRSVPGLRRAACPGSRARYLRHGR